MLETTEIAYLSVWALLGSVLGFLAFTYTPNKTPAENISRGILSVCIGLFIAFPFYVYLEEMQYFSKTLNIMLSGLIAFGLPDFIMTQWPKLIHSIASGIVGKIMGNHSRQGGYCRIDDREHKE